MAEIVTSAVVQETVSQVLSGLVQKYEEKEESNVHYWKPALCYMPSSLSCAFYRAHDKEPLCRVYTRQTYNTRWRHALPCVFLAHGKSMLLAHDKVNSLPCVKNKHTANHGFAVCFILTHGKIIIFFSFELKTFSTFYI